jgi:8-oxo-dGTP diphosphatase
MTGMAAGPPELRGERSPQVAAPASRTAATVPGSVAAVGQLYVVRHADAGSAAQGGSDRLRGLSERGLRQADGLRSQMAGTRIARLLASPFQRCLDTLRPLGEELGMAVEADDRLAEGTGAHGVLQLAQELWATTAVVCSHGDVIPDVLEELGRRGVAIEGELRWPKASVWVLTGGQEGIRKATYLPPPC